MTYLILKTKNRTMETFQIVKFLFPNFQTEKIIQIEHFQTMFIQNLNF